MFSDTCCCSSGICLQSHEMYAMRDPLHIGKKQLQGGNVDKDKEESCIFSCPSLSGIAFAAVAAALPLLARSDVEINSSKLESSLSLQYNKLKLLPYLCFAMLFRCTGAPPRVSSFCLRCS